MFLIRMLLVLSAWRATGGVVSELPFKARDGFLWIEVSVPQSRERLHFILDTGAQVSVINSATAQRLGLKRGRQVNVEGVSGAVTGFWPQSLEAHAGGVRLPEDLLMLDLQALSRACTNSALDGIIGADFFRQRIVQIDYAEKRVRILSEAPVEPGTQVLPLQLRPWGMLVHIRVNQAAPQWVRLDTGCASALQWVTGKIRPERVSRRLAIGLTSFTVATTQTAVTLGTSRFEGVPTDLRAREIFAGEKGLLGNGLLSRFKTVTIDTQGERLLLGATMP